MIAFKRSVIEAKLYISASNSDADKLRSKLDIKFRLALLNYVNHNNYNFLKRDWCINCIICQSVIGHLAVIRHL